MQYQSTQNFVWIASEPAEFLNGHFPDIQVTHKNMVRFQKLRRNLFLTLHGHNVHRQQRQLSKFLMRYQQFASHAYCGVSFQNDVAAGKGFLCVPF
jgi:calcineurin-like phosphoesterase family protein